MSEPKADSLLQRSEQLLVEASRSHLGVFLTGPNRIEILSDELPMNLEPITHAEVVNAAKALKNNRANGTDQIPGEFWKAIW